jgi:PAS domain S-box-containing protein
MKPPTPEIPGESERHRQAEARLAEKPASSRSPLSPEDSAALIHELQVHQIELEMQNEDLRVAQLIIENSNKRFSDLYDFAPVGYLTVNTEGIIIEANLTASKLFDVDTLQLTGKPFSVYVHAEDKDIFFRHLAGVRKGASRNCEIRLNKKDGVFFQAELVSTQLSTHAKAPEQFLMALFDITTRKRAEEAWESSIFELNERLMDSNRELERLGHTLSHDLRGPIVSIEGLLGILFEKHVSKIDTEVLEYLKAIGESAHRMSSMITGLLNLSSIATEKLRIDTIDISALVRNIADVCKFEKPPREAEFIIQDGLFAQGDYKLMQIALDNLIRNAWKFTGKRQKAVIEFGTTVSKGKTAFFLRDNGAGFNTKYADTIFTMFKRLHSQSEFKGTGIGLATVERIIRRHGGQIWAESEVDKGAYFYFTLL